MSKEEFLGYSLSNRQDGQVPVKSVMLPLMHMSACGIGSVKKSCIYLYSLNGQTDIALINYNTISISKYF